MNEVSHLVLSSTIDYSSDLICAELEKRRFNYLRLNRDRFTEYEIEYALQDDTIRIKIGDIRYLLSAKSMKSIYFRAPVFLRTTGKAYTVEEQLKRSQWSAFIRNLIVLDKALWINHPVSIYRAENKLYQLKVAKQCGMAVPETYVGNSLPQNIVPESMYIVKSLDTALFYDDGKEMFTYSTMVSGQELLGAEIKVAPIIIQEYLNTKIDLRVTVIGNRIFPVSITKQGEALVGDWRRSNKDNLDYIPIELPQIINEQIAMLMQHLDLSFGGIDLALVGSTYYFIEVNPTGEWGWLTSSAGIPVDKAIVDCMAIGGAYG
ncbi:MAG: hypothetical protein EOM54_00035 [Clostridia bacterium]|nr:hypothetical protein [Clostridia bacterium]